LHAGRAARGGVLAVGEAVALDGVRAPAPRQVGAGEEDLRARVAAVGSRVLHEALVVAGGDLAARGDGARRPREAPRQGLGEGVPGRRAGRGRRGSGGGVGRGVGFGGGALFGGALRRGGLRLGDVAFGGRLAG